MSVTSAIVYKFSFSSNAAEAAASSLGLDVTTYTTQLQDSDFMAALAAAAAESTVLIIDSPGNAMSQQVVDAIIAFVSGGGHAIMSYWDLDAHADLQAAFGVAVLADMNSPETVHDGAPSPMFDGIGSEIHFADRAADDGDRLQAAGGATEEAHFTSGGAAMVVGNDGRTVVNGFLFWNMTDDPTLLITNQINYLIASSSPTVIEGTPDNDNLIGTSGEDRIYGYDGHDYLRGDEGDDALFGGAGDDYLRGGLGDDLLDGGDGWDRVAYTVETTGGVTVDLNIQGIAQNTGGAGWDTLVDIEHASGTIFDDVLTGNAGDNWLWGGSDGSGVTGNDTIIAGAGNDLVEVGTGTHSLDGGSGTDTLMAFGNSTDITSAGVTISLALQGASQDSEQGVWLLNGFENLSGSIYADNLTGDGGANVLAGDIGSDNLVGGAGSDTLYGDGRVRVDTHGVGTSGPIVTVTDIAAAFGLTPGDDTLEGGLGDDTLDGGGGTDTASYANAGGGVTVHLGSGFASGADGNDALANIENVTGSQYNDTLTGNGGDNVVEGLGGNDTITGQGGNDTLHGGDGDDFLRGDATSETSLTVSGNDVIYGANGNDNLRGGLGDDQLYGGANNDLMRGNGGVDSFDGGSDDGVGFNGIGDRVSFFEQRATQGVVADLRTGIISNDGFGNVETMVGIESLGADTAFVDTFYGNEDRNYLFGNRGDLLYGFGGDDIFAMTSAAGLVDGGSGTDQLRVAVFSDWLMPDEDGDGLAEFADYASAGWTINLAVGSTLDGYGNSGSVTGVENVTGSELGDTLIGNANTNVLNGGAGDDMLEGGLDDDTLDGGGGSDMASYANASGGVTVDLDIGTASGADGNDSLANIENVTGSAHGDTLTGNGGANSISGGGGNDRIGGGGGADALTGGAGADTFVYTALSDSAPGAADLISSFSGKFVIVGTDSKGKPIKAAGEGDKIDLSGIDANTSLAGDQAFTLANKFTGVAGQAFTSFDAATNLTSVYLDVNGDKIADATIQLAGQVNLIGADFIL